MFLSSDPLSVPSLMVGRVTNSVVEYQAQRNDDITNPLITGYEVIRFGVPMIGEYVNAGTGRTVTISPAVPGARYRITAWALSCGNRSATPAVVYATTGEASECGRHVCNNITLVGFSQYNEVYCCIEKELCITIVNSKSL